MTRKTRSSSSLSSLQNKTGNPDKLKMKKSNKDTKSLDGSVVKVVTGQEQGAEKASLDEIVNVEILKEKCTLRAPLEEMSKSILSDLYHQDKTVDAGYKNMGTVPKMKITQQNPGKNVEGISNYKRFENQSDGYNAKTLQSICSGENHSPSRYQEKHHNKTQQKMKNLQEMSNSLIM